MNYIAVRMKNDTITGFPASQAPSAAAHWVAKKGERGGNGPGMAVTTRSPEAPQAMQRNLKSVRSPKHSLPAEGSKGAAKQRKGLGPYGNLSGQARLYKTIPELECTSQQGEMMPYTYNQTTW